MGKKNNHTGSKFAAGALIAGAAGYLAGVLTAPKAGKETREDIALKAGEVKSEAETELTKVYKELTDLTKEAKTKTLALSAQARDEFNEAVVKARDAQDKAGHVLKAVKAGEADDPQLNKALKQAKQAKRNLGKYFKS